MPRVSRIGLQPVGDVPAVDVGQLEVERDRVGTVRCASLQPSSPAGRHQRVEAALVRQVLQRAREHGIVFDDQQQRLGAGRGARAGRRAPPAARADWPAPGAARASISLLRQIEGEGAADALLAFDIELAAQQARDLAADRQPQPGAAVAPRGAGVGLLERFEDQLLLVGRDADAGVADAEGAAPAAHATAGGCPGSSRRARSAPTAPRCPWL